MDLDLTGKVALVTGGAARIGAACARELASLGASVAIADVDLTGAKAVAEELDERALPIEVDVVGSVTSAATVMTRTIAAPRAGSCRAKASPMPLAAPVITAFSSRRHGSRALPPRRRH